MDKFYRYYCRFGQVIVSNLVAKSPGHKLVFASEANLDYF